MDVAEKAKINIRPATIKDADEMAKLFMRTWQISLSQYVPAGFLDQFQYQKQKEKYILRVADPQWIILVAKYQGKIVGMIGVTGNDSQPILYQKQIKSVYVDPDFQKQGVGRLLLEKLFSELQKQRIKNVMLWCMTSNQGACSFYEKHGGQRIENISPPEEYASMPHVIYAWEFRP